MHVPYNDLSDHVTKTGTNINWYQALKRPYKQFLMQSSYIHIH